MLISRHIIYTESAKYCIRVEIVFEPPVDIDSTLGKVESIYKDGLSGAKNATLQHCKPIVNANGLLHAKEVMKAGELLTIRIRPGHRFQNLVIDQAHQLQVIPDLDRLQYWITTGKDGAVELTGVQIKDDDGFYDKLQSNLKDIPFRAYIVQCSLADAIVTLAELGKPSDLMDTKEASRYLGISDSTLFKKAQAGLIPRTPHKKFRRVDLDAYLAAGTNRTKRKTKLAK